MSKNGIILGLALGASLLLPPAIEIPRYNINSAAAVTQRDKKLASLDGLIATAKSDLEKGTITLNQAKDQAAASEYRKNIATEDLSDATQGYEQGYYMLEYMDSMISQKQALVEYLSKKK